LAFVIIGEAANRIPPEVQTAHPDIPRIQMKAMRNRLVHTYFSIDPRIVWDTLARDLPPLKAKLAA
jgi:uncharacterized protein with HEPN domain